MRDSLRRLTVADIARAKRATIPGKNRASRLRGVEKSDSFGLRREMLLRISAIENMVPTLKRAAARTRGNRAPEALELFPPDDLGTDAIEASLAVLEARPALTPSCAAAVMEAATRLFWLAGRIKADVMRQAGAFVCNASKPRSLLGQADIRLLFYYVFADRLAAVAHAAFEWVNGSKRNLTLRAGLEMAADIGVKEIDLSRLIYIDEGAITLTRSINHSASGGRASGPTPASSKSKQSVGPGQD